MKKILGSIIFVIYVAIVLTVTILLLSYNEYMCSEINGYTLYIVRDDMLEPDYVKGDLLVIKHVSNKNVDVGDKLYFYQNVSNNEYYVRYGEVTDKIDQGNDRVIYTIDNKFQYDSSYLIGEEEGSFVYNKVGTILSILESRWGYLFFVVIITLLLFLEELYELYMEIKYGNEITKVKEG